MGGNLWFSGRTWPMIDNPHCQAWDPPSILDPFSALLVPLLIFLERLKSVTIVWPLTFLQDMQLLSKDEKKKFDKFFKGILTLALLSLFLGRHLHIPLRQTSSSHDYPSVTFYLFSSQWYHYGHHCFVFRSSWSHDHLPYAASSFGQCELGHEVR